MPNGSAVVAQELGVSSEFPTQFEINLTNPPPDAAVQSVAEIFGNDTDPSTFGLDPALTYALGTLLVYADNNKNGKFDLVITLASGPSPDTVLGVADQNTIFYQISGTPAPEMYMASLRLLQQRRLLS